MVQCLSEVPQNGSANKHVDFLSVKGFLLSYDILANRQNQRFHHSFQGWRGAYGVLQTR